MLSKLRHFARGDIRELANLRSQVDVQPALEALGAPRSAAVPVNGGTLGVGFSANIEGRPTFLKACALPDGSQNLEKEIDILSHLYGDTLAVRRIETQDANGVPRVWLVMRALSTLGTPLAPQDILDIVRSYASGLAALPTESLNCADTLGTLVDGATQALADLTQAGLIGQTMHDDLSLRLTRLRRDWPALPPRICHGDLGRANIMMAGEQVVVIDWEDAFIGVDGYDYLYWLTFFENRQYYARDVLGGTPLGVDVEISLLAMILLLKCRISLAANTHAGNRLTFEQRINEVLALA